MEEPQSQTEVPPKKLTSEGELEVGILFESNLTSVIHPLYGSAESFYGTTRRPAMAGSNQSQRSQNKVSKNDTHSVQSLITSGEPSRVGMWLLRTPPICIHRAPSPHFGRLRPPTLSHTLSAKPECQIQNSTSLINSGISNQLNSSEAELENQELSFDGGTLIPQVASRRIRPTAGR